MSGLAAIDHVVVLMLENRSFDHMLGFLYADAGNISPTGQPFEGLTGQESCPDASGNPVTVVRMTPSTPSVYFMPGADPGEGYVNTNEQLFGSSTAPAAGTRPAMQGFVTNYATAIADNLQRHWYVVPGTKPEWIMNCHSPQTLPVLSALARGFAVCDHWFCSVPTQTMPNRAFVSAGTSQGHLDNHTKVFTVPSIFGRLEQAGQRWRICGYDATSLTQRDFPDTAGATPDHFGQFADFQHDCAGGTLPAYTFLEPNWSSSGNSEHPNYDMARGEQLLLDTYHAVRTSPQWPTTGLVITFDEHGGCYDHVAPPWGATPPDASIGEFGFDFTRFGVRVPTVLISPLIPAGTVFRSPTDVPLDHTSVLATLERRWGLPALTARDAAAPDFGAVFSLETARTDDPLAGVTAPPRRHSPPTWPPRCRTCSTRSPSWWRTIRAWNSRRRSPVQPRRSSTSSRPGRPRSAGQRQWPPHRSRGRNPSRPVSAVPGGILEPGPRPVRIPPLSSVTVTLPLEQRKARQCSGLPVTGRPPPSGSRSRFPRTP
ncbi:alkaline phosphatase family protein [Raineyella fluvialis]|uniref:alkaline phosphatase family protein n=1 Tax=Raineyella fluvialis TaxID=2662261 RepID=UPI001E4F16D8|nr:alkaline phosphatase family protein [Raineyella fluvialis]